MSRNLFRIPSDTAGKVLSFLVEKEAFIFYITYKILNKTEDFVPEDYYFSGHSLSYKLYSKYKYIKNLHITGTSRCLYLNWFQHLEGLKIDNVLLDITDLNKLTKLKNLSLPLGIRYDLDLPAVLKYKQLEKYKGNLRVFNDEKERLNLSSFSGIIRCADSDSVLLDTCFNHSKLQKLNIVNVEGREIFNLSNFINLKKLALCDGLRHIEDLRHLTKIEDLSISYNQRVFDWTVLSNMTNLKSLTIRYRNYVDGSKLSPLIIQSLTKLSIENRGANSILNKFPLMVNLKSLILDFVDFKTIKYLPSNLEELTLRDLNGVMNNFQHIQRLSSLRKLTVGVLKGFRSSMMKYIGKLYNLEELYFLNGSSFSVESLNDLRGLSKLKKIKLFGNKPPLKPSSYSCLSHIKGLVIA